MSQAANDPRPGGYSWTFVLITSIILGVVSFLGMALTLGLYFLSGVVLGWLPDDPSTEFIWRRLAEPASLFGNELSMEVTLGLWLVVLCGMLWIAFFYVGWMYVRDAHGVGPFWAILLGMFRTCVYVVLGWIFLMPAWREWEESVSTSKVVAVADVSGSMLTTKDDLPKPGFEPLTRQEKVQAFLGDRDGINFFPRLLERNPVTVYRIAGGLDDAFLQLTGDGMRTKEEHLVALKPGFDDEGNPIEPPPALELPPEYWLSWLQPGKGPAEAPPEWTQQQKDRLEQLKALNEKLRGENFFSATNVPTGALAVLNRELNNRVQGIILFSDGRTTEGSLSAYRELADRAEAAKIPIFVVAVGDERPRVNIKVGGLLLPQQVRPEDHFRAVVTVTGEGLANKPVDVFLELTHTRKDKDGKDEELPITLVEAQDEAAPKEKRAEITLPKKVTLLPASPPKFDTGNPPRAEVEYVIDAKSVAAAAKVDLTKGDYAGKKWELAETPDSELVFQVRVPKDKLEIFPDENHLSEKGSVRVLKKPLRVLLFASAPTRQYQFLRTLLVRETDKKRMELSIHLQPAPGRDERRLGVVQDVPPERLLTRFPDKLDSDAKGPEQLYDLSSYDVILAFDPDWRRLTPQTMQRVKLWVEKGGGLVVVGGPINTLELARPGASKDKYAPILELYPVVLSDIRVDELERDTKDPWPLSFEGATPEMEFLKLDEADEGTEKPFLQDWAEFFHGKARDGKINRGIVRRGFHSYYPVKDAKAGTLVVARFGDPKAKLQDGSQQPYIVVTDPASGRRVVWLGSGELWRLRMYKLAYHERFWTKMVRYAGAKSQSKVSRRVDLYMEKTYKANQFIDVEAKIDAKGGEPLDKDADPPVITLKLPQGVRPDEIPTRVTMNAKPGRAGWFAARFPVRSPGGYELELRVPETGDLETKKFTVTEANPELDNTRPDFGRLYQIASPVSLVLNRIPADKDRQELLDQLRMPASADPDEGLEPKEPGAAEAGDSDLRLFFTLQNAKLIPECMITSTKQVRSRGPVDDLWDEGFVIWERDEGDPIRLSYVLVAVVALLSMEWLIRKLLRLA